MVDRWRNDSGFQRHDTCQSLHSACSTYQMTRHRLGRIQIHLIHMLAEHALDGVHFRDITQRRRGTMCIDEIDLFGFKTCVFDRQTHYTLCALSFRIRRSHMVSIRGHADAHYLCINFRTACFRMLIVLQDQTSSSFTQHEAVTTLRERTTGRLRTVITG